MHNRQSAPSHTGAAMDGQLLIIVLLNTQFSEPATDYSAGAIRTLNGKGKFQNRGHKMEKKEDAELESAENCPESC